MARFTDWSELNFGSLAYGDPFRDYSSQQIPSKLRDVFKLAEQCWFKLGTYRQAIRRLVRYFITPLEFHDVDIEENERWEKLLTKKIGIQERIALHGDDLLSYGNSITAIHDPFIRFLRCPKCHLSIRASHFKYKYRGGEFGGRCPNRKCGYQGKFEIIDRKDPDPTNLHIIRWNIREIELKFEPITGYSEYYWSPPDRVKKGVQSRDPFWLDNLPYEVITCVENGQRLVLNPKTRYHMKMETLCGVDNRGWGIPPVLSNFGQIWHVLMLRLTNEAIALDYLLPLRIITPAAVGNADERRDPISASLGSGYFLERVLQMIEDRRTNPTNWYALPFPVQYGPLGGEGHQMLHPELFKEAIGTLLNDMGIPIEFFQGTLQVQAAPTALRQLEKTWDFFIHQTNNWLDWATDTIATIMGWDPVDASLSPTTIVDDIARKQLLLQLAFQGDISMDTAFRPWRLRYREEQDRRQLEEEWRAQRQMELERALSGKSTLMPAALPPGAPQGAPPIPLGAPQSAAATPPSLEELVAQADQTAQQLMGVPDTVRISQLRMLGQQHPTLHALVKQRLSKMDRQTDREGGMQLRSQVFGQP